MYYPIMDLHALLRKHLGSSKIFKLLYSVCSVAIFPLQVCTDDNVQSCPHGKDFETMKEMFEITALRRAAIFCSKRSIWGLGRPGDLPLAAPTFWFEFLDITLVIICVGAFAVRQLNLQ